LSCFLHVIKINIYSLLFNNAQDIIEELNRAINAERKRKITQEMQELAAGAGLLENW